MIPAEDFNVEMVEPKAKCVTDIGPRFEGCYPSIYPSRPAQGMELSHSNWTSTFKTETSVVTGAELSSGKSTFVAPGSNEVISELLEILVKKELHARHQRGEDWLSDLPAEAVAKIESAKVIKDQEAYHLSLIIDMVGTGQVRPFATVLSTDQGTLPVAPPPQIPKSWHPLYNALRELLLSAMNSLTALKGVSN